MEEKQWLLPIFKETMEELKGSLPAADIRMRPKGELMDMAVSGICLCHQELLGRAAGQGHSGRPTGNVHGMGVPGQGRQFCTGCLPLCGSPWRKSQGDSEG